jgi:hypothetical protein
MVTNPLFFTKEILLFKNGQKKCPKSKSQKNFPNKIFKVLYNKLKKVLKEKKTKNFKYILEE